MSKRQHPIVLKESIFDPLEARCECGQLVAKLGAGGVELKCKRCKRLVSIPFSALSHSAVTFQLCTSSEASTTES